MSKRAKAVVGLDIDAGSVAAVEVSKGSGLKLDRIAMVPLETGIVRDGEVLDVEGLTAALRTLYSDNRGLGKRVRVGVANQKIVVRVIELPYLGDHKEMEAAVRFHAQDQIPMPLDQAVIDFQLLDVTEGVGGRRQRVLLVAARRDMVNRTLDAVRGAGLRAEGVDLSAFAMIRALYQPTSGDDPVLYVCVGGLTNIAVAHGTTCVFTRASGGGLEALATDLAERRTLTLEHARGWLEHVGLEAGVEDIEGDEDIVVEARRVLMDGVRRIAAEIRNSLDFHHSQGGEAAVSHFVLTGPAAAIPGFATVLGSELGLPGTVGTVEGETGPIHAGALVVAAGLTIDEVQA
jgi:type IV pilus assembly protein PilM